MSAITRNKIEQALLYIEQNLDSKLSAQQIADAAFLSSFHFQRMFSLYLGESLSQYVLHRRVERAAKLLIASPQSILTIALDSGFETHSAFSKVFKLHFGVSPSKFRTEPQSAQLGRLTSRPYLKTLAADKSGIGFETVSLPTLHFNYNIEQGTVNGSFLTDSQPKLLESFSVLAQQAGLFGLVSAFPASPQSLNDQGAEIRYGGLFYAPNANTSIKHWMALAQGLWAVFEHKGSYDFLYQTWNQALCMLLNSHDYELRESLPFEMYLTSPATTPEKDWLTQLYIPIKTA